jgi:hypothetical protein
MPKSVSSEAYIIIALIGIVPLELSADGRITAPFCVKFKPPVAAMIVGAVPTVPVALPTPPVEKSVRDAAVSVGGMRYIPTIPVETAFSCAATEDVDVGFPLPPFLLREGQVEKLDVTDCDAPEIVTVAEQLCGPVPTGGGAPGVVTVKSHCVPAGETSELSCNESAKLPSLPSAIGPTVPWKGIRHGAEPCPALLHC